MTDDVEGASAPKDDPEPDEALRRVYGDQAVFSKVGAFTLVHLDEPSPDEIKRRIDAFDPDEFFFDDCPLCQSAKAEGGHIVFDASEGGDPLRDSSGDDSPSVAFDRALAALAVETEAFMHEAKAALPEELARRCVIDIAEIHDHLVETLWSQKGAERLETFERLFARAVATLADVRVEAASLEPAAASVQRALEAVAAVWQST